MGRVIVRVPPGWAHPRDDAGDEIDGGHLEPLYRLPESAKTAFQIYQNVSAGSPVSPVFATLSDMKAWLIDQGQSAEAVDSFVDWGFAPSAVASVNGVEDGMEGLNRTVRKKKRWPWFRTHES
jgi:hypothetical protein